MSRLSVLNKYFINLKVKIMCLNLMPQRLLNYLKTINLKTLVYFNALLVTKTNMLLINSLKLYTLD